MTWGSWHPEAAKVFLTGAVVDGTLQTDPYYVGLVWNRVGVQSVAAGERLAKAQSYSPDATRELATSVLQTDGAFQLIGFNLPSNVLSATGVQLVDVTNDPDPAFQPPVYTMAGTSAAASYTNVAGTGRTLTVGPGLDPALESSISVTAGEGNTDGYDLDAIRVYKCAPQLGTKTATGMGTKILPTKGGTWFMYNTYTDPDLLAATNNMTFPIQLNNPAVYPNNTIGTYTVVDLGGGQYKVTYQLDPTYTTELGGWTYGVEVVMTHLGIQETNTFTAIPAKDDNRDFDVEFSDADGSFLVFAHFVIGFQ